MDLDGKRIIFCVHIHYFIGDMPQQQANRGTGVLHRVNISNRRKNKSDHLIKAVSGKRFYYDYLATCLLSIVSLKYN
jgi:hypothetical protein